VNLAVLFAALLLAPPPPAPRVYNGRLRHLEVCIPRFDERLKLDGVLDEPVWKQAAVLTGFSQFSPTDGIAAEDSIEVLVWFSATAINFGVRAFEIHGAVHATLASRDKIDSDDYVQLLIGTFNDGRQAMLFGVNPFGVQQDGIITETGILRGGSGFGSAGSVREAPDLNPDFVFRSRGTLTEYGYEVEVSIPFKTLRFQPTAEQAWGLQVIRKVQHNGHEEVWAPANRAAASFLAQSGRLVGLTDLRRERRLADQRGARRRDVRIRFDAVLDVQDRRAEADQPRTRHGTLHRYSASPQPRLLDQHLVSASEARRRQRERDLGEGRALLRVGER
jgi:hypothetical protein